MRVRLVGRGHTWTKDSLCTSFVIDEGLVLDVPQGSFKRLYYTTSVEKIHTIVISHLHCDHWFDLHILCNVLIYRRNREKITILGPRKLKSYLKKMLAIGCTSSVYKRLVKRAVFKTLKNGCEYESNGYVIKAYKVDHCGLDAYGFVISDGGTRRVGFTGDTILCDNVGRIIDESDLIFMDSSNLYTESKTHMSIRDYEYYEVKFRDKRFVPVHLSSTVIEYLGRNGIEIEEGTIYDTDKLFK